VPEAGGTAAHPLLSQLIGTKPRLVVNPSTTRLRKAKYPGYKAAEGVTMRILKRILAVIVGIFMLAVVSLAIAISYDGSCRSPEAIPTGAQRMKAVVFRCYGSPDVLKVEDVAKPAPKDDELLVKVHAASVNPLDWHYMRGEPYVMRLSSGIGAPKDDRAGVDFAGTVEAIGKDVTRFKVGERPRRSRTSPQTSLSNKRQRCRSPVLRHFRRCAIWGS
jgi:hypothetical protein